MKQQLTKEMFWERRTEILEFGEKNSACDKQLEAAKTATDIVRFANVCYANLNWLFSKGFFVMGEWELPVTLTSVGGDLDLRDTGVTSLGALTSVGEYLYLRDTGVTLENVPKNLHSKCRH